MTDDNTTIAPDSRSTISMENGKPCTINVQVPTKFFIRTISGTEITGLLTPNNPLVVTGRGDITEFNLTIEKDAIKEPSLVHGNLKS